MTVFKYDIAKEYKKFLKKQEKTPMDFHLGNDVLYKMCEDNPLHDDTDVIVSKVWLIGRSYAAAIERRRNKSDSEPNDNFYYDVVAPQIKKHSQKLDRLIEQLNTNSSGYQKNAELILELHKYMVKILMDISGLEKRSLASKYLHFHCRDNVFIYDSRSCKAAKKVVQRQKINRNWLQKYDKEYAIFLSRILAMTEEIESKTGIHPTPRDIDNFLLYHIESLE